MASWAFKYDIIQREYNIQDMTSWAFKYDIIQREYNTQDMHPAGTSPLKQR